MIRGIEEEGALAGKGHPASWSRCGTGWLSYNREVWGPSSGTDDERATDRMTSD